MKKYKKSCCIIILVFLNLLLFSTCAYASNISLAEGAIPIDNARQYSGSREARVIGRPRGRFISSVEITMTNKGGGTIGIYADILCHEPMKEIRMWLILEKWLPDEEVWETIQPERFEWKSEDFPDQDLTMAIAAYDISKLERGQDYRIQGLFGADTFTPGINETWSINTPNFFLE